MAQLKKDGTEKIIVNNKKKGKSSRVMPLNYTETKLICNYFKDHNMWIHYLMFGLSVSIGRRFSDMVNLKWCDFFNPATGELRPFLNEIQEKKTKKLTDDFLTIGVFPKIVISNYIAHIPCCVPSANNYNNYMFIQYTGNYQGNILSISSHEKALNKAGIAVGIPYNIGTHTARKTFAANIIESNAGDPMALYNVQAAMGHSSPETTLVYSQNFQKKTATYTSKLDSELVKYVAGDEEYVGENKGEIIRCRRGDVIDFICDIIDEFDNLQSSGDNDAALFKIYCIKKLTGIVLQ